MVPRGPSRSHEVVWIELGGHTEGESGCMPIIASTRNDPRHQVLRAKEKQRCEVEDLERGLYHFVYRVMSRARRKIRQGRKVFSKIVSEGY